MDNPLANVLRNTVLDLLDETFINHHGLYTDKGTSLFETLAAIDFKLASKKIEGIKETIAGHVFHVKFYIIVIQEYIIDVRTGKTDWNESWVVEHVTQSEWKKLIEELKTEYQKLIQFIKEITHWDNEDYTGGVLSIIAHCAYHLGAIRQMIARL